MHRGVLTDGAALRWLTAEVMGRRFRLENERAKRMAFEHKGLRANFMQLKKNMDALGAAIAKGNEIAPAMTADIQSMVNQVASYQDDLKFMGEVLGNGSGEGSGDSGKPKEQPGEKQVIQQPDAPPTNPAPVSGPPAVGQTATFRNGL